VLGAVIADSEKIALRHMLQKLKTEMSGCSAGYGLE